MSLRPCRCQPCNPGLHFQPCPFSCSNRPMSTRVPRFLDIHEHLWIPFGGIQRFIFSTLGHFLLGAARELGVNRHPSYFCTGGIDFSVFDGLDAIKNLWSSLPGFGKRRNLTPVAETLGCFGKPEETLMLWDCFKGTRNTQFVASTHFLAPSSDLGGRGRLAFLCRSKRVPSKQTCPLLALSRHRSKNPSNSPVLRVEK